MYKGLGEIVNKRIYAVFLLLAVSFSIGCGKIEEVTDSVSIEEVHDSVSTEEVTDSVSDEETNDFLEQSSVESSVESAVFEDDEQKDEYDIMIENMTLREKVGLLFFIRPEDLCEFDAGLGPHDPTGFNDEQKKFYEEYPAGGFVLFEHNIVDEEQLNALTYALNTLPGDPLLCIDEEGGIVSRIARNKNFDVETFESMEAIALTGDTDLAYHAGDTIGNYLKKYGFDIDFAPVADLNTNPKNPIIGERAFGADPYLAGEMVNAFINGLHDNGIGGCTKHFPGHGDTSTDTHTGYAKTEKTLEEIRNCELIPFKYSIDNDVDMIMVAHISTPNITGNDEPASLSYDMITKLLREELGYDGVVITDALEMKAVSKVYSSGEASVKAFEAGADILLMPVNYKEAFDAVYEAVTSGEISEERLDESVKRILKLKVKYSAAEE